MAAEFGHIHFMFLGTPLYPAAGSATVLSMFNEKIEEINKRFISQILLLLCSYNFNSGKSVYGKIANYNFMKNRPWYLTFAEPRGASVRVSVIFVALKILHFVANVAIANVELCSINCLYSEVGTREKVLNVRSAQEKKDASQLQLLSSWKVGNHWQSWKWEI